MTEQRCQHLNNYLKKKKINNLNNYKGHTNPRDQQLSSCVMSTWALGWIGVPN